MSDKNPYEQLGIIESASFEEIQAAKQHLSQQYYDNCQELESIEVVYDAIIMERLRMRLEGKIEVPEYIRFPERFSNPLLNFSSIPVNNSSTRQQQLIDRTLKANLLLLIAIFLILSSVITIFLIFFLINAYQ